MPLFPISRCQWDSASITVVAGTVAIAAGAFVLGAPDAAGVVSLPVAADPGLAKRLAPRSHQSFLHRRALRCSTSFGHLPHSGGAQ